jgi:hypothetical protein
MTQAEQLHAVLRGRGARGMTYLELLRTAISTAPWKRLEEGSKHLRPGERVDRFKDLQGRVRFKITRTT